MWIFDILYAFEASRTGYWQSRKPTDDLSRLSLNESKSVRCASAFLVKLLRREPIPPSSEQ
jgi:hypothetical protein